MNDYTVYEHKNKKNGKRYIGITKRTPQKRWNNGNGYIANEYFYRAIVKYGWEEFEHNILFYFLSKEEAEQKETYLIKKYKSNNYNFGYNIKDGGNCSKHTEETKKKIGLANKGEKNGMFGKKLSEETINKKRINNLGIKNPMYGRKNNNEEKYKKIIGNTKRIIIIKKDLNNNFICEYPSARQAAKDNNTDHKTIIRHCKSKTPYKNNLKFEKLESWGDN